MNIKALKTLGIIVEQTNYSEYCIINNRRVFLYIKSDKPLYFDGSHYSYIFS